MFIILFMNTLTNLSQYLDNLITANVTLKFIPDNSLLKKTLWQENPFYYQAVPT